MTTTINTALQNFQADAVGTDLDGGFIDIYTGTQPAPNVAPTGTLLVSFALPANAYQAAAAGVVQITAPLSGVAVANGVAGYAQQRNAANTRWMYGSVTVVGGGGQVQLTDLGIDAGNVIVLTSSTITQPSGV